MPRDDRNHNAGERDQRNKFQQDRDRVLYSSAFRRLSGITQIVRAGEADVFHTRQQHTLKVAQVGLRLAELLVHGQEKESEALGIDAEVVEAAALIHDLGHPPFGHVGEHTLNKLVENAGDSDGFEGNAQSFRIITKLAIHYEKHDGLDLCRATLAAALKYPWLRDLDNPKRRQKWGAYRLDESDFVFATKDLPLGMRSTEAAIMDWADDISYSVHDLEDFHRCGAIPWRRLLGGQDTDHLLETARKSWFDAPPNALDRLREAMKRLNELFEARVFDAVLSETYEGTRNQRLQLRTLTSMLIDRYITATVLQCPKPDELDQTTLIIDFQRSDEVLLLKQITKHYVISHPTLRAQQKGHESIITTLFELLYNGSKFDASPPFLPRRLSYIWDFPASRARRVADCIASLTEAETIGLWRRLTGYASGSVLDPIVR